MHGERLSGKVAIITGGTSGIGAAICRSFIAEGAKIVFTGLESQGVIDSMAAGYGDSAVGKSVDAGSPTAMTALLTDVAATHGRIDILVANAGIGEHARFGMISEDQFDRMLRVNLKGVLFASQSVVEWMKKGGSIIWIGSTGSTAPVPNMSVYCGLKAALPTMAQSIAQDLKGTGIRVNVLSPGTTDTESLRDAFVKSSGEEGASKAIDSIRQRNPSGRIGAPSEIAAVAVFLASDEASYINGAEIFVDGGLRRAG